MSAPHFDRRHADDLMSYVGVSPTPFHAVAEAARRLEAAGFTELAETDAWDVATGAGCYVKRGGSLIAWHVPENVRLSNGFRIVGGHTDSPHLHVKPLPDTGSAGWRQVGVEIYGGVPHDTWLDRDLGVAGRMVTRDGDEHLVSIDTPLLRVPRLAIHLDRQVNSGQVLDAQTHMTPVWGLGEPSEGEFVAHLAKHAGLPADEVAGWDLALFDVQPPAYLGKDAELLASGRLDNLSSVHAGLSALLAAARQPAGRISVLAAFDHEECGNESYSGAASPFLNTVLRRVLLARGAGEEDAARAYADSIVMSSDTGHGVHPNYSERHEPSHWPRVGAGPILKVNASQRYATDGAGRAVFERCGRAAGVEWQSYVHKNSLPCGTTVGPITAANTGIPTVDVGVAILSMHASRELCGASDVGDLAAMMAAFYTDDR